MALATTEVDVDTLIKLVNVFGIPITFMFCVLWGGWRIIVWLRPRAEKLVDNHIGLIETLKRSNEAQTRLLDSINSLTMENTKLLGEVLNRVQEGKCDK